MKLMILDGNSIVNRAFYGVTDLTNSEGLHTNAIYGFLNTLFKVLEEEKPDPEAGPDVYVMGEYCWDEMGRYINIYYGSFAALLGDDPRQVWVDELRTTLRHELTHHVEGLAGERSLEYKDSAQLAQFQAENQAGQEDEDGV